jgi:hypothetical protein
VLVFERLWEETGCRNVIADLAGARGHKFALERAVFLTVLHRLFVSGSDRAADRWREDYMFAGVEVQTPAAVPRAPDGARPELRMLARGPVADRSYAEDLARRQLHHPPYWWHDRPQ